MTFSIQIPNSRLTTKHFTLPLPDGPTRRSGRTRPVANLSSADEDSSRASIEVQDVLLLVERVAVGSQAGGRGAGDRLVGVEGGCQQAFAVRQGRWHNTKVGHD